MKEHFLRFGALSLLLVGILAVFIVRTAWGARGDAPRLGDLFTVITLAGSLAVSMAGHRCLRRGDWVAAIALGGLVGLTMPLATLFSPYPFLGLVRDDLGQAFVRGSSTTVALLGGLVVMRRGGPVPFRAATGEWRKLGSSLLVGLAVGAPLAAVNVLALQLTQGRAADWQNPLAALLDALQPGIVEEVVYRFALLGLLWLVLQKRWPQQAPWLSALLAMLVHNFQHFDDLFVQAPLVALGMGLVMALLWGVPPTILALRRDLDSAMAFHWIQDAARFLAGY